MGTIADRGRKCKGRHFGGMITPRVALRAIRDAGPYNNPREVVRRMMWMMWLSNFIWLAILILMGLGIWTWYQRRPRITQGEDNPLAILELRLARGDITPEEYDAIRRRLTSS